MKQPTEIQELLMSECKHKVFKNKSVFFPDYCPPKIILSWRKKELSQIIPIFQALLNGESSLHTWVYGASGSGKTLLIDTLGQESNDAARQKRISAKYVYTSCRSQNVFSTKSTATKVLRNIAVALNIPIKQTCSSDIYFQFIIQKLKELNQTILLVLDDIHLLPSNDINSLLGLFSRIHEHCTGVRVSVIAITNNLMLPNTLNPDVKSSFGRKMVYFHPYHAVGLQEILQQRAEEGFNKGSYAAGVVAKCAALGAQTNGDARFVINLLRVSAEIVEAKPEDITQIIEDDVDLAGDQIEKDEIIEYVRHIPRQVSIMLLSVIYLCDVNNNKPLAGAVFEEYERQCRRVGFKPCTQRRVADWIGDLSTQGIINATILSKGRYGRTTEVSLCFSGKIQEEVVKLIEKNLYID